MFGSWVICVIVICVTGVAMGPQDECQSTPALMESSGIPTQTVTSTSLGMIPEHTLLESCTRLSISLEQNGLFKAGQSSRSSSQSSRTSAPRMTLDELRDVNRYAESTKSLSYLPLVHERQTARMRTRSEWFLSPMVECTSCGGSLASDVSEAITRELLRRSSSGTIVGAVGLSMSAESIQKRPSIRRSNSRDKRYYLHRSSSRRNKENGSRSGSFKTKKDCISRSNSYKAAGTRSGTDRRNSTLSRSNSFKLKNVNRSNSFKNSSNNEPCTCSTSTANTTSGSEEKQPTVGERLTGGAREPGIEIQTIHVTLTYKPRI